MIVNINIPPVVVLNGLAKNPETNLPENETELKKKVPEPETNCSFTHTVRKRRFAVLISEER